MEAQTRAPLPVLEFTGILVKTMGKASKKVRAKSATQPASPQGDTETYFGHLQPLLHVSSR